MEKEIAGDSEPEEKNTTKIPSEAERDIPRNRKRKVAKPVVKKKVESS